MSISIAKRSIAYIKHSLLVGAPDSGKTEVLKHVLKGQQDLNTPFKDLPYFGVYFPVSDSINDDGFTCDFDKNVEATRFAYCSETVLISTAITRLWEVFQHHIDFSKIPFEQQDKIISDFRAILPSSKASHENFFEKSLKDIAEERSKAEETLKTILRKEKTDYIPLYLDNWNRSFVKAKNLFSDRGLAPRSCLLLVDDADRLNLTDTRILNTAIFARIHADVAIKAAIKKGAYKTYKTRGGDRIERPHDYSEISLDPR